MRHLELIADGLISAVKSHITAALGPLTQRLDEFDAWRKALPVPKDGAPGAKGDPGERGPAGDKGEPGERGADGKDIAPEVLEDLLAKRAELAAEAFARRLIERLERV